jgi:hypothetical protein
MHHTSAHAYTNLYRQRSTILKMANVPVRLIIVVKDRSTIGGRDMKRRILSLLAAGLVAAMFVAGPAAALEDHHHHHHHHREDRGIRHG